MALTFTPAIVDEQRRWNAQVRAHAGDQSDPSTLDLPALRHARLFRRDGTARHACDRAARDVEIVTELGSVGARLFRCKDPRGMVVHFHGGGWALGSIHAQDGLLRALVQQTSLDVLSVDYPLAPEAGLGDILAIAQAALVAVIGEDPGRRVAIFAESAGAHIALSSLLAIRDRGHSIANIRAMSLFYGIYDLSMTASQRAWGPEFLGLSTPWLEYFYELVLPGMARDARGAPWISPLNADLAGLPPALLSVGTLDPLVDDSVLLHAAWLDAGNEGRLDLYPDAAHGFNHTGTAMARHANHASGKFLAGHV